MNTRTSSINNINHINDSHYFDDIQIFDVLKNIENKKSLIIKKLIIMKKVITIIVIVLMIEWTIAAIYEWYFIGRGNPVLCILLPITISAGMIYIITHLKK